MAWRVAAVALALLVSGVCVRLGFWQLDRLEQRRAYNSELAAAISQPPLLLDSAALRAIAAAPDSFLYRRAMAEGVLDPRADVILRGRSHNGQPGIHLIGALRIPTGEYLLVNRGWVPSPDAATADPRPFRSASPQRISGYLRAVPPVDADPAPAVVELPDTSITTWRRLPSDDIADRLGAGLPPLYLEQAPDSRAFASPPIPVPAPALDEGPHLGYAIQWFSFAAIAVVGLLVAVLRSRSTDRRPVP